MPATPHKGSKQILGIADQHQVQGIAPGAEVESALSGRLPPGHFGFHLLDSNEQGLRYAPSNA